MKKCSTTVISETVYSVVIIVSTINNWTADTSQHRPRILRENVPSKEHPHLRDGDVKDGNHEQRWNQPKQNAINNHQLIPTDYNISSLISSSQFHTILNNVIFTLLRRQDLCADVTSRDKKPADHILRLSETSTCRSELDTRFILIIFLLSYHIRLGTCHLRKIYTKKTTCGDHRQWPTTDTDGGILLPNGWLYFLD